MQEHRITKGGHVPWVLGTGALLQEVHHPQHRPLRAVVTLEAERQQATEDQGVVTLGVVTLGAVAREVALGAQEADRL